MPRQFWLGGVRNAGWRTGSSFDDDRNLHGELYAHMVWIWKFVFSVAVFLAMAGFLLLILQRANPPLTALVLAVIVAVGVYYRIARPNLGVD